MDATQTDNDEAKVPTNPGAEAPREDEAPCECEAPCKCKPTYSKKRKRSQAWERGATRASIRVADAVALGLSEWDDRSRKSSKKKKDGAYKDAFENAAKSASKALREASDAPEEFWKGFDKAWGGKSYRKLWWGL